MYLRPLVEELLQLWREEGVRVWDEHKQKEFDLRVLLFVTINDWPALSNISVAVSYLRQWLRMIPGFGIPSLECQDQERVFMLDSGFMPPFVPVHE